MRHRWVVAPAACLTKHAAEAAEDHAAEAAEDAETPAPEPQRARFVTAAPAVEAPERRGVTGCVPRARFVLGTEPAGAGDALPDALPAGLASAIVERDRRSHAASAGLHEAHAASVGLHEAASPRAPPLGGGACGMHDEIAFAKRNKIISHREKLCRETHTYIKSAR